MPKVQKKKKRHSKATETLGTPSEKQTGTDVMATTETHSTGMDIDVHEAAREKIRELVITGHGSRTGRLQSWLHKLNTLADKMIELGKLTHVMEQNDAVTEENMMFSDEMEVATEIMIEKGRKLLQVASQIKCA